MNDNTTPTNRHTEACDMLLVLLHTVIEGINALKETLADMPDATVEHPAPYHPALEKGMPVMYQSSPSDPWTLGFLADINYIEETALYTVQAGRNSGKCAYVSSVVPFSLFDPATL